MAVSIPIELYEQLEQQLGKDGAKGVVNVLRNSLENVEEQATATLLNIDQKAEHLIRQKKFELKNELTQELATKEDLARLEEAMKGESARLEEKMGGEITRLEEAMKGESARLEGEMKSEIIRLEGEMKTQKAEMQTLRQEMQTLRQEMRAMIISLDRKYMIMYLIMLFTIIFLNQNALTFIAKLLGLIK